MGCRSPAGLPTDVVTKPTAFSSESMAGVLLDMVGSQQEGVSCSDSIQPYFASDVVAEHHAAALALGPGGFAD